MYKFQFGIAAEMKLFEPMTRRCVNNEKHGLSKIFCLMHS